MRSSFYRRSMRFDVGPAPMPVAGPGEALLRVHRVGICGSDLHIFQGHLDHRVPVDNTIGHEVLAEVLEAPKGSPVAVGRRTVVNPVLSCGACRACQMGASYLCYKLKILGVDAPGGMQDYWAAPAANLIGVPPTMSDDDAALVEPLAVAVHDVGRAKVGEGDAVLVYGGGPIGCLIALVARARGARVKVVEINPFRIGLMQKIGIETIGPGDDTKTIVLEWTNGVGADVVFEVTGDAKVVPLLTELARVWGTISVIAIHSEPVTINLYPMFARELTMHGSRLYTRAAWEEAIELVSRGAIPVGALVTGRIPLEGLQQGMEQALGGGPVMKILVDMSI
jgi:(R,R)-butanediol dehydrogenase/meso-butanediol dehydrogenase/diacetyl reductase